MSRQRLLGGVSLVLLLVGPPAGATSVSSSQRDAPALLRQVDVLLSGWRAGEAEQLLAELSDQGLPEEALATRLAVVRFYQGEYAEARRLLGDGGDPELRRAIQAAEELAQGMREVSLPGGSFRVRVHPGPDEVLIPLLAEALPRIQQANEEVFAIRPRSPIVIEVYASIEELGQATGLTAQQIEDSGTIAICKFNRIMITSPRATVQGYSWLTTVSHEYLHLLINHRAFQRVPIWLHEGLARYNESWWSENQPQRLLPATEQLLLGAAADGQLITFEEMSPSMALLPTPRHTELAFAEVLTVIDLLYRKVGRPGVNRILDSLGRGETSDAREAIARELGQPFARFEAQWRQELRARPRSPGAPRAAAPRVRFKKADRDPLSQELEEIDRKSRDFAYLGQLLRAQRKLRGAIQEYRKAAAASNAILPQVQNWIAATHLELAQPREALAALQGVVERAPGYAATHIHQGLALALLQEDTPARASFEAALGINPFDQRVRRELLRIYRKVGDPRAEREEHALRLLASAGDAGSDGEEEAR
ncbi:MAG: hypothetical protein RBU45_05635 [Myxococcota bacterium]|jgi:tetratricopeptide (TPR) repeat protein|nr:hypothetical protein [Myxococcota bacterium]